MSIPAAARGLAELEIPPVSQQHRYQSWKLIVSEWYQNQRSPNDLFVFDVVERYSSILGSVLALTHLSSLKTSSSVLVYISLPPGLAGGASGFCLALHHKLCKLTLVINVFGKLVNCIELLFLLVILCLQLTFAFWDFGPLEVRVLVPRSSGQDLDGVPATFPTRLGCQRHLLIAFDGFSASDISRKIRSDPVSRHGLPFTPNTLQVTIGNCPLRWTLRCNWYRTWIQKLSNDRAAGFTKRWAPQE